MINVIVLAVVVLIVGLALRKVIKNHGKGCDCGCGSCPSACHCNDDSKKK